MTIKKDGSKWLVDIRPSGRSGKRFRRKFDTKSEALAYEKHVLATYHNKEWLGQPKDKRHLSELIGIWWKKSGQFKRSSGDALSKVNLICKDLNDPCVYQINKTMITEWKTKRLEKGQTDNTIRRLLTSLSNVFTVLIETGDYNGEHPLKGISTPKSKNSDMTFLSTEQIVTLLEAITEHDELRKIVKICIATGSRWTETVSLKAMNLTPYRIMFTNTKTGKPRTVPISKELFEEIYPRDGGALFQSNPWGLLRDKLDDLFDLPKSQKTHVLRHTFASHFIINGGNILTLKEILGHHSITQTMTYAHLAPDHLQDAIKFNPLPS
ncbi:phage integrase [Vibrio nigripulchritudo]|uniref:phage integrase n=1 Tax=Vibrio nigripulchritudo TaxID=28173 RepID=UPI0005FA3BD3|nr:tyrosine-type recombinase/integrase [Vibrio nigripulchritudo]KJY81203.1 integrase [Vibrio nigripulchritudo]